MAYAIGFPEPNPARKELLASLLLKLEELRDSMVELKRSTEDWVQAASSTSQSSSVCDAEHAAAVAAPPTAATPSIEISTTSTESMLACHVLPQVTTVIGATLLAVPSSTTMAPARCSTKCPELEVDADADGVANKIKSKASTECMTHAPDHILAAPVSSAMDTGPSYINVGPPTKCSTKCSKSVDVVKASAGVPVTALTTSPTTLPVVLFLSLASSKSVPLVHANLGAQQVFDEIPQSYAAISSYNINMLAAGNVSTTALESLSTTTFETFEDHASTGSKATNHLISELNRCKLHSFPILVTNCRLSCFARNLHTITNAQEMFDIMLNKGKHAVDYKTFWLDTSYSGWLAIVLCDTVKPKKYSDQQYFHQPWPPPVQMKPALILSSMAILLSGVRYGIVVSGQYLHKPGEQLYMHKYSHSLNSNACGKLQWDPFWDAYGSCRKMRFSLIVNGIPHERSQSRREVVVISESWIISAQPWQRPIPLKILCVNTEIRPLLWPSFSCYLAWCSRSSHPSSCKWELNSEVMEQRPPWPPPPVSVRQEEKSIMLMRSTRDCWSYIECDLLSWFDCELITTGVGMVDLKPWPPPICSGSVVGLQLVCSENADIKGAWIFLVCPWCTQYETTGTVVDFSLVVKLSQEHYELYNVKMQSIVLKLLVACTVCYSRCSNKKELIQHFWRPHTISVEEIGLPWLNSLTDIEVWMSWDPGRLTLTCALIAMATLKILVKETEISQIWFSYKEGIGFHVEDTCLIICITTYIIS